jgi:8-oxo-dGTP diphosphatase
VVPRPSAYALLARGDRIAIVRAPDGCFLPGGGIERGETPAEAVVRECEEECALRVRVLQPVARAIQYAPDSEAGVTHEKQCTFFAAVVEASLDAPPDPGHETLWVLPAEAKGLISHPSQAWAVDEWARMAAP